MDSKATHNCVGELIVDGKALKDPAKGQVPYCNFLRFRDEEGACLPYCARKKVYIKGMTYRERACRMFDDTSLSLVDRKYEFYLNTEGEESAKALEHAEEWRGYEE